MVTIEKWKSVLGQTIYIKRFCLSEMCNRDDKKNKDAQPVQLENQPTAVNDKMPAQHITQKAGAFSVVEGATVSQDYQQKHFMLDSTIIDDLLARPEFKQNKTVGKVFKVIQALIDGTDSPEVIARQFSIELAMVKLLKAHVK